MPDAGGDGTERTLNLFAHRSGGVIILEFEIVPDGVRPTIELYSELRATIAQLKAEKTLQSFFDLAVSHIRRFTGFERVMAYKFLEDGSGHVIAESIMDGFKSYLGLHYPANDIPAPARRLFALAWLRHLPNADYKPVPLLPENLPGSGKPLDLSYAMLRSVSAMYTGYLKNMGVKASMVMPLMKDGALWGLLACNHETSPRHVPHETRIAAEFLAHMISLMMAAKEDAESFAYRLRMKTALDSMTRSLNDHPDLHIGLGGGNGQANISQYIDAGGAAIITEGLITRLGDTPSGADLKDLAVWLSASPDLVFATDRLPELYPHAASYTRTAAGFSPSACQTGGRNTSCGFAPSRPRPSVGQAIRKSQSQIQATARSVLTPRDLSRCGKKASRDAPSHGRISRSRPPPISVGSPLMLSNARRGSRTGRQSQIGISEQHVPSIANADARNPWLL